MINQNKSNEAYLTIGEVTRKLDLVNKEGQLQTHTIRYWESQFKQIKPTIKAGGRRYYSQKNFKMIKYIKFLLKERGLTIDGVKKVLNKKNTHSIDGDINIGINSRNLNAKNIIRNKVKNISKILKEIKKLK